MRMRHHLHLLTDRHRTVASNRTLGLLLAFNAGAVNAGGFLLVHSYTSHMTGFVSLLADNLVLGNTALVLSACGALLAFLCGAAATSLLVNWARHHLAVRYKWRLNIHGDVVYQFLLYRLAEHLRPCAV